MSYQSLRAYERVCRNPDQTLLSFGNSQSCLSRLGQQTSLTLKRKYRRKTTDQRPNAFHALCVVCPLAAAVVLYVLLLLLEILALFSQCSWWGAQQMLEMVVQVALISKAHGVGDLSNRQSFLEQQRLGTLNPTRNHILMGS